MTSSASRPLVAPAAAATGCLPRGDRPAGRQIIADRRVSLADIGIWLATSP